MPASSQLYDVCGKKIKFQREEFIQGTHILFTNKFHVIIDHVPQAIQKLERVYFSALNRWAVFDIIKIGQIFTKL